MKFCLLKTITIVTALSFCSVAAQNPYQVQEHWLIGGTGGWDYLVNDSDAHRLYVTHGSRVEVVDTNTGKLVGAIAGLSGTHGVALDDAGQFGYISNGAANNIAVFDRKSLAVVATVPAGTNPDCITYEPVTKTVWAFNGRSKNVTVVSTADHKVIATVSLPGKPEFAQPDGKGKIFVNIEDRNSIVALDANQKRILHTWTLPNCSSPSGLAIDQDHARLFAVCDEKKMAIVSATTGQQIATAVIGEDPDAAGFDSKGGLAFASTADGVLSVVNANDGYKTIEMLPTMKGARTMTYDPAKDRIYVVSAEMGTRPAPTKENPKPRAAVQADTFQVVVIGRK